MRCTHCGHNDLIEIRMAVGGEDIAFRRCARCDAKAWVGQDGRVALGDVLDLARPARAR
jgi:DNA-directed RNA polymerase subunit RPC12/RpoP